MPTSDPRDPLDRKIDSLLASKPLPASRDFTARVLAAADQLPARATPPRRIHNWRAMALPVAAAIAVLLSIVSVSIRSATRGTHAAPLSSADIHEIFLLEEALSGLPQLQDPAFSSERLLHTLDTLDFDLQS